MVLSPYYIDKYQVSNQRYKKFMDETGHAAPAYWDDRRLNKPNYPVVGVNWYDAKSFCEFEGKRLPTEAEWEKAAKGPKNKHFPWGEKFEQEKVNCCQDVGSTSPIDSHAQGASESGIFHMAGNVYEWVSDWYDHKYYGVSPPLDPQGPDQGFDWGALGEMKVVRGGSWFAPESSNHNSHRFWNQPENNSYGVGLGFRCAMDAPVSIEQDSRMAYMKALIAMGGEKNKEAMVSIDKALKIDRNNRDYIQLKDAIQKQSKASKK